jgi:hypothetical protein
MHETVQSGRKGKIFKTPENENGELPGPINQASQRTNPIIPLTIASSDEMGRMKAIGGGENS